LLKLITGTENDNEILKQESRADAGVSMRQSRHLAITYELGFSTAIEAVTCAATWRKR